MGTAIVRGRVEVASFDQRAARRSPHRGDRAGTGTDDAARNAAH